MPHRFLRLLTFAILVPMSVLACGGGSSGHQAAAPAPTGAMPMQPGAENMKVSIISPANGAKITGNTVALQLQISGFQDSCDAAGKKPQQGIGHYHIELDKALVNMFCAPQASISLQNVKPGQHAITVMPAQNDHEDIAANAQSITIDYEPTAPLSAITAASTSGKPTIKITSPKAGSTISGPFDVTVEIANFNSSCDLLGKPDVAGYGHWHLNVDSDTGAMMGMMTMFGMSCSNTLHSNSAGLSPGKHTLIALLTDNGHAPFNPDIADRVDVTVGS